MPGAVNRITGLAPVLARVIMAHRTSRGREASTAAPGKKKVKSVMIKAGMRKKGTRGRMIRFATNPTALISPKREATMGAVINVAAAVTDREAATPSGKKHKTRLIGADSSSIPITEPKESKKAAEVIAVGSHRITAMAARETETRLSRCRYCSETLVAYSIITAARITEGEPPVMPQYSKRNTVNSA